LKPREHSNYCEDKRSYYGGAEAIAPLPLTHSLLVPRTLHQFCERRLFSRQLMIPLQQVFSLGQNPVRQDVVIDTLPELVNQSAIGGVLREPRLERQLRPVVD
jgi:hypothetical protein